VTFADERVVDLLNTKFVLAWDNHGTVRGGDGARQPVFTKEELALYPEGAGGANVRTFICKPDGSVVHAVEGWYSADRYLEELHFGVELLDAKELVERHAEHARHHRDAQKKIEREEPGEMAKEFVNSAARRRHAALGLQASMHELAKAWLGKEIAAVIKQVRLEAEASGEID